MNRFTELAENRSEMFNFFFENNDLFHCIDEEDEEELHLSYYEYLDKTFNVMAGTFAAVLFID
ncbi:MAG: hypothetical protein ACK56F_00915 [bacterium]